MDFSSFTFSHRPANGLTLHVAEAGQGPLMVFLHGWPECWYSWRNQMAHFKQWFHVVAPDLRGFNLSDKPQGVASYRSTEICEDIVQLIQGYGEEKAVIVAHDWGGAVAWLLAARNPEVVSRLIIMNAPHPKDFEKLVFRRSEQFRKSWYMFFFQIPYLAEGLLKAGGAQAVEKLYRGTAWNQKCFTPEDLEIFRVALFQPGALTGGLNYYRAAFRSFFPRSGGTDTRMKRKILAPTQVIWGKRDKALCLENTATMHQRVDGTFALHLVEEAGHWVQQEQPEEVNRLMEAFVEPEKGKARLNRKKK